MKEPCSNEDCDLCYPGTRWRVSTKRVAVIEHVRDIKAATLEEALRIYEHGTAWPSSYDDRELEVLSEEPTVAVEKPRTDRENEIRCHHRYREPIPPNPELEALDAEEREKDDL